MLKGSTMSSIGIADAVNQDNSIGDDCSLSVNPVLTLEDDDFDDFDDFQEAGPSVNNETINPSTDDEQSAPLADESNNEPKKQFSAYPLSSSISNSSTGQEIAPNQSSVKSFPSLDKIVNQSFIKNIGDDYVETEQTVTSDLFNDKSSQSYKMWESLLNPDESTSFRLNWESSHTFQVFLRSLKIDNKDVDNFFVTFESSSEPDELTMSSPVSVTSQSPENQIVTKISSTEMTSQTSSSSSSSLPPSSVILPTTNSTESMPQKSQKQEPSATTSKTENTNSSASLSSLSSSSSSSSSSSTNKPNIELSDSNNQSDEIQPSTNNQLSNNLLDVTFFLNNPNFMQPCSSPKASLKVNESEQSVQNNEASTKPLSIISSSSTDPFHNLISHIQDASSMRSATKSQSSATKSTLTPSESTNRIFEELPLLSFMRTKLLMFPMRDSIKD